MLIYNIEISKEQILELASMLAEQYPPHRVEKSEVKDRIQNGIDCKEIDISMMKFTI